MGVDEVELLTVRETARRLGVHENTVRNWARSGVLADARVPGSRFHRFRSSEVQRLLTQRGAVAPSLQAERRSANPELVNASQLKQWPDARARDAQSTFPELMRRLLAETPGLYNISIRAGDGVALPGYDGIADSDGTSFLPAGQLGFEFSVRKDVETKATGEYEKRAAENPSNKAFVFVTPRRWARKERWSEQRRRERLFADVKVLDADDLEGWLATAPATHHWISEHLGLRPHDATSLEAWWRKLGTSTAPALPPQLFLAGRSEQARELARRLQDRPNLTVVQSETAVDCLAFIHAALTDPVRSTDAERASALRVSTAEVWQRVTMQLGNAILIPDFEGADISSALESGHHVVTVLDGDAASRRPADIVLPRLGRRDATEAFVTAGVDFLEASRLATLGRRSLPALMRRVSLNPVFSKPAWTSTEAAACLAPLVLVGSWTTRPEDLVIVEAVTGLPWRNVESIIMRAASTDDPVLRRTGSTWALACPEEAFLLLQGSLTSGMMRCWSQHVRETLLAPDSDPGSVVSLESPQRSYSAAIRRGMAQGLALLGTMGETTWLDDGASLAEYARSAVGDILREANSDPTGRLWRQVADVLPLMSEASPDVFLSIIADELDQEEPVLRRLFEEEAVGSRFSANTLHFNLLWALETVSWSSEYIVDACRALARLAPLESSSRSGNRPINSLSSILCGWVRHTSAPLAERLRAIDAVYALSNALGWELTLALWPSPHASIAAPAAPRFRDWRPNGKSVPLAEYATFIEALVRLAIKHAGGKAERLAGLVDRLDRLAPADRERIIQHLEGNASSDLLDEAGKLQVWESLQALIAHHERFSGESWAFEPNLCARLSNLAIRLEPHQDPRRFAHLFEPHPELAGVDASDISGYVSELAQRRAQALDSLFSLPHPLHRLADLARRVASPSQLGWALGDRPELGLAELTAWLGSSEPALAETACYWARHKMAKDSGEIWLANALRTPDLDGSARQLLVQSVPAAAKYWHALRGSPRPEDVRAYWTGSSFGVVPSADVEEALEQLTGHARAWAAIAVLANALGRDLGEIRGELAPTLTTDVIVRLLKGAAASSPGNDMTQMTPYHVAKLLDYLVAEDVSRSELASLEYAFFRLLEHQRAPSVLEDALAHRSTIFVDLVKLAFRGRNSPRRELGEAEQEKAIHAWWVLKGWRGFPGRREDGSLDAQAMRLWVREARLAFSDADRQDIGDELIGGSFANSPLGSDDAWPAEPLRELIEEIGSRELEHGLVIGRLNARGMTSRDVFDGGKQERNLAKRYDEWSRATNGEWPRTSRLLRELSRSYERDANREDVRAELDADQD